MEGWNEVRRPCIHDGSHKSGACYCSLASFDWWLFPLEPFVAANVPAKGGGRGISRWPAEARKDHREERELTVGKVSAEERVVDLEKVNANRHVEHVEKTLAYVHVCVCVCTCVYTCVRVYTRVYAWSWNR